jgi:signal transduction histidine kinase
MGAEAEHGALNAVRLREANASLVLATLQAQTMVTASELAAVQLREANEHLVIATVHAQMMTEVAEQATVQTAYRAKLEAELLESRKLETLGLLAGGVAHDFNNLITTIMGYADRGSLMVDPDSEVARFFKAIDKAAGKAAELTRHLLAYAGQGRLVVTEVDLGMVVKEMAQLLTATLPREVTLHCDLADALPSVEGDPTQLFQIVMNLVINAAQACPAGTPGQIRVRTGVRTYLEAGDGPGSWILPMPAGHPVLLEVSDNGAGMAPEILARIFDPFFTTKRTGHGLGLAAVVGILRSHGGGLRVWSQPGQGASFTLFLPAVASPMAPPPLVPQAPQAAVAS